MIVKEILGFEIVFGVCPAALEDSKEKKFK